MNIRIALVIASLMLIPSVGSETVSQNGDGQSNRRGSMDISIPFKLVGAHQTHILIPVFVNGNGPYDFIFDTGSATTSLLPEFARQLAIKSNPTEQAIGVGSANASEGSVSSLRIGGAQVENLSVVIVEGINAVKASGADLKGTIGINYMKHFVVTIDYRNSLIHLAKGHNEVGVSDSATAPGIRFPDKPVIVVPAIVNGKGPYGFVVETGSGGIAISEEVAQSLELKIEGTSTVTGVGDPSVARRSQIKTLTVGSATVQNTRVIVANFFEPLSKEIGVKVDGLLGYPYLKNFTVVIDFPNSTLYLK